MQTVLQQFANLKGDARILETRAERRIIKSYVSTLLQCTQLTIAKLRYLETQRRRVDHIRSVTRRLEGYELLGQMLRQL